MRWVMTMRWVLCAATIAAGFTMAVMPGQAKAQTLPHDPYKWCAVYSMGNGDARNCGFKTLAQCQLTVSGIGGACEINSFYNPGKSTKRVRR